MVVLDKDELPKPGHVMAIIEAMNKSNIEKPQERDIFSRNSMRSFGYGASLIFTHSTLSRSSSSIEGSVSGEFFERSDDLEAIYDNQYSNVSTFKPNYTSHVCQTKPYCVCHKKKCGYMKAQKHISKSLGELDDSSSLQEEDKEKNSLMKYFSYRRQKKSKSSETYEGSKTLALDKYKPVVKSNDFPLQDFEACQNLSLKKSFPDSKNKLNHTYFLKSIVKRKPKSVPRDYSDNSINGHTTVANPNTSDNIYGVVVSNDTVDQIPKREEWKTRFKENCEMYCNIKHLSLIRIIFIFIGLILFLSGATYDVGLKFLINAAYNNCWSHLKEEYINFGEEFIEYQRSIFSSQISTNNFNKFDKVNAYIPHHENIHVYNPSKKFLYILENLEFSIQVHFFNILDDISRTKNNNVKVKEIGPLYFKVSFRKEKGFEMKYIQSLSNMTLKTTFEMYDIMKALLMSNQVPYFGFHMKDFYKTTPSSLFKVFIDALNKFKINTSFLSPLKSQIDSQGNGIRRKRGIRQNDGVEYLVNNLFLPLPPDVDKEVNLHVSKLNKDFTLKYRKYDHVSGIKCLSFILKDEKMGEKTIKHYQLTPTGNELIRKTSSKSKLKKTYPEAHDFYPSKHSFISKNNLSTTIMPSEVIDLNPMMESLVREDISFLGKQLRSYPFWISSPHFVSRSSENSHSSYKRANTIEGLSPDENRHGSFIYYHPILGVPINASVALQMGVYPPPEMLHAQKLVPIMWIRIQLDKMHPKLWYLFWGTFYIRLLIMALLILSGTVIIICAFACRCRNSADEQMV